MKFCFISTLWSGPIGLLLACVCKGLINKGLKTLAGITKKITEDGTRKLVIDTLQLFGRSPEPSLTQKIKAFQLQNKPFYQEDYRRKGKKLEEQFWKREEEVVEKERERREIDRRIFVTPNRLKLTPSFYPPN